MRTSPPRAFGYLRVSTDEQGRSGLGLDDQRRKVEGYAALHDLALVDVVTDVASASNLKRDRLTALLAGLRPGDALIVAKLDRLTRSVRDLADLVGRFERRRVSLVSVGEHLDTGSAAGRLVMNVMACIGQWEREAIGERTSAALQTRKRRGLVATSEAPFGFQRGSDGQRVPHAGEQAVLAEIVRQRAAGRSLRAIAAALTASGATTRAGGPWRHEYVARILGATTSQQSQVA